MDRFELLAPAGSYENFKAALSAGADAVYLGGNMFGARAYANNFSETEVLRALDYAHIHNRSVYMTVNTLLKQNDIEEMLVDYLKPYYENGLDGVIVQDLGVARVVRENFPGMPIHASTQMSVSGVAGAKWLKDNGFTRVVPARELTLAEIKDIYDNTGLEIESFIHGALCYCYSGQCLLSSMIGGRSGNRGRCAQPCRLEYSCDGKNGYWLSPKDMCTINIIPKLLDNGVYSMKIEGRMKSREYTSGVVSIYRKYVNRYLEHGQKGYKVERQDIIALTDLYNRGGFNEGYYLGATGAKMMSVDRPNHAGTPALKVKERVGNKVVFTAVEKINKGDVFEINADFNITSGVDLQIGQELAVQIPAKFVPSKGTVISRIKNQQLVNTLVENYCQDRELIKEPVEIFFEAKINQPISLVMHNMVSDVYATVLGQVAQKAQKQPVTPDNVIKQISKLNDTPYSVKDISVNIEGDCFVPLQAINDLRRQCVNEMNKQSVIGYKRQWAPVEDEKELQEFPQRKTTSVSVLVSNVEQLRFILEQEGIDRVYVEYNCFYDDTTAKLLGENRRAEIFGALPRILRGNRMDEFKDLLDRMAACRVDGFLVRNLEEGAYLKELKADYRVVSDYSMYAWNNQAVKELKKLFDEITAPLELNGSELAMIEGCNMELPVYGYFPVMLSAQCVKKTTGRCDMANGSIIIKDRANARYNIVSNCRFCHTVMYNDKPVYIAREAENVPGVGSCRYEFTVENTEQMKAVLDGTVNDYIKGHFTKGVL